MRNFFLYSKNFQKFLCKTCAIRFLMSKAFHKAKFHYNLTSESGSKQIFSLLQEKEVIPEVCLRTQAVSIKAQVKTEREGIQEKLKTIQQPQTETFWVQLKKLPGRNMVRILFHFEEFNLNPERGITGISSLSCEKNVRNTLIVSFKNVI